jgi:hypothetical protein
MIIICNKKHDRNGGTCERRRSKDKLRKSEADIGR